MQAVDGVQQGASHIPSRDHRDGATPSVHGGRQLETRLDCGIVFLLSTHTDSLGSTTSRFCWVGPGDTTQAGSGAAEWEEASDCRTSDEKPPPPPPPPPAPPPHPSSAVQTSASHMFFHLYNLLLIGWLTR